MPKTKVVADGKDKTGPAPTEKRPTLQPAKANGPQRLQRAMMTATGGAAAMTAAGGAPGRARTMGALQRTLGNARMARMAAPAPTAGVAGANGKMRPIQTKLTVGPANDPFEREADAAAGRITAGQPVGRISRLPAAGLAAARRKCSACGKEMEERPPGPVQRKCSACEEEEEAQRQPAGTAGGEPSLDTEGAERAMSRSGPGSPLAPAMRTTMEKGFGADFSGVRVHTGPAADEASRAVNARAFTRGSDIYLARGESPDNQMLLAHELTHTVQQCGANDLGAQQYSCDKEKISRQSGSISGFPGGPDPCFDLLQEIIDLLNEVARRINDALDDPHNLYRDFRTTPHPEYGSWDGHRDRFYYDRDRLRHKISEWEADDRCRGYPLSRQQQEELNEADEYKNREFPERPARSMFEGQEPVPAEQPSSSSSWDTVLKVVIVLGLSIALVATIVAALADPEPASKLALAGLALAEISALAAALGFSAPSATDGA